MLDKQGSGVGDRKTLRPTQASALNGPVAWLWAEEPPSEVRQRLADLVSDVAYLGEAECPAVVEVVDEDDDLAVDPAGRQRRLVGASRGLGAQVVAVHRHVQLADRDGCALDRGDLVGDAPGEGHAARVEAEQDQVGQGALSLPVSRQARDEGGPYGKFNAVLGKATANVYSDASPIGKLGGPPEAVAATIEKAITAKRPRPRYRVTPSAHLMIAQKRLLPDRAWDAVMRTQFPRPR